MKPALLGTTGLAAVLAAVTEGAQFERTISLGAAIIALLLMIGTLVGIFYGVRYKVSYETAASRAAQLSEWLDEAQEREARVEQRLAEALEKVAECTAALADAQATIARLEAMPDVSKVVEKMGEVAVQQDAAASRRLEHALANVAERFVVLERSQREELARHEERAVVRHEAIVASLEKVADGLEKWAH